MNNSSCHHPFHGFGNNVNYLQRFREEPQLRPGTLSQPSFQAPQGAYASSGVGQPLMKYQAVHHAYQPSYHHLEGGRRPAPHEAFAGNGLGNISSVLRQTGTAQPLQDSRSRILETAGHQHAAHRMQEIQRRQLEENMVLASLVRNLSSNGVRTDPAPWSNHAHGVANGGQEHGSILVRGDGVPFMMLSAPVNASGNSSGRNRQQQQPRLVDYMGVQGVRVALGDVKAMVGSLRETPFDVPGKQGEANNAMNLDLTLGSSGVIDLTLSL